MDPAPFFLASPFTHPLTLTSIQLLLLAFIIGYTAPSSPLRPSFLPLTATLSWHVIHSCPARVPSRFWRGIFASYSSGFVLQYADLALLGNWTFPTAGPRNPAIHLRRQPSRRDSRTAEALQSTIQQRVRFGIAAATDSRRSGSAWEVKGVPPFSQQEPSYVPARGTFLRHEGCRLVAMYLVLDAMASQAPSAGEGGLDSLPQMPLLTRLPEVTVGEVVARVGSTLGVWTSIYCIVQLLYSAGAVVSVASGLSEPRQWRPLFGSWSEAFTLRRFWGYVPIALDALLPVPSSSVLLSSVVLSTSAIKSTYHQLNRQKYSAPASFITYSLLRFRHRGLPARCTFTFFVFLLSGLQHTVIDVAEGLPWDRPGSLRFYIMQFAGIMVEDMVQELWRLGVKVRKGEVGTGEGQAGGGRQQRGTRWVGRCLGYMWVLGFLAWTTPGWIVPRLVETGVEQVLPFSVVGRILEGRK
ncbi:hypothetical protein MMC13_006458 [Lambiella insularis]|nr:hypothetical protein [Lambiella insularis]